MTFIWLKIRQAPPTPDPLSPRGAVHQLPQGLAESSCVCLRRDVCAYSCLPVCTSAGVPRRCMLCRMPFSFLSVTRPRGAVSLRVHCAESPASSAGKFASLSDFVVIDSARFHTRPSTSRILPLEVLTVKSEDTCIVCFGARLPPLGGALAVGTHHVLLPSLDIRRAFWLQKPVASLAWHVASGALSLLSFDPGRARHPLLLQVLCGPPSSLHLPGFFPGCHLLILWVH